MINESSSNPQPIHNSSAVNPTDYQAWQKALSEYSKPKTPAQIRAAGDVKVRVGVLWLVGVVCSSLALAGIGMYFWNPTHAKDLWVIIGPIITAGVTGVLGYLTGEKNASSR